MGGWRARQEEARVCLPFSVQGSTQGNGWFLAGEGLSFIPPHHSSFHLHFAEQSASEEVSWVWYRQKAWQSTQL